MKTASAGMISFLGTLGGAQSSYIAELITITLADGTVLRYTTGERDITLSGNTFSASGPLPIVGSIGWKIGVEVDTVKLQLWALLTNLVESQAILAAIIQGLFDNALVLVQRVFMPTYGDVSNGAIILLAGQCFRHPGCRFGARRTRRQEPQGTSEHPAALPDLSAVVRLDALWAWLWT